MSLSQLLKDISKSTDFTSLTGVVYSNIKKVSLEHCIWVTKSYEATLTTKKSRHITVDQLLEPPRVYLLESSKLDISELIPLAVTSTIQNNILDPTTFSLSYKDWQISGKQINSILVSFGTLQKIYKQKQQVERLTSISQQLKIAPLFTRYLFQASIQTQTLVYSKLLVIVKDKNESVSIHLTLYTKKQIEDFLDERIHQLTQETLPICSKEEKGTTSPTYKLVRQGKSGWRTVTGTSSTNLEEFKGLKKLKFKVGDEVNTTLIINENCLKCTVRSNCNG